MKFNLTQHTNNHSLIAWDEQSSISHEQFLTDVKHVARHLPNKKYAINLMELIGASWGFIRFPFYRKSFKYAVTSAILASILIGASAIFVLYKVPEMGSYLHPLYILITLCILLILALIIHLGSTHYLLNKYLKDR